MMRTNRLLILSSAVFVLSGCVSAPPVYFRQPTVSSSSTSTAIIGTGDTVGANEAMPVNTDSLEAGTSTGGIVVPVSLTSKPSILFGSGTALPTLTEYFDYDCDYCREFALTQQPWIEHEFVATKQINVERVFAPQTTLGIQLAQAAICAGLQGDAETMDHALMTRQPQNLTEILATAKKLKLKITPFTNCMRRTDLLPAKTLDADGKEIKRVPTFALGSVQWQGILAEEGLRAKIEELLKNK